MLKTILSATDCIGFLLNIIEAKKAKLSFKPEFKKKDYHLSITYITYPIK